MIIPIAFLHDQKSSFFCSLVMLRIEHLFFPDQSFSSFLLFLVVFHHLVSLRYTALNSLFFSHEMPPNFRNSSSFSSEKKSRRVHKIMIILDHERNALRTVEDGKKSNGGGGSRRSEITEFSSRTVFVKSGCGSRRANLAVQCNVARCQLLVGPWRPPPPPPQRIRDT